MTQNSSMKAGGAAAEAAEVAALPIKRRKRTRVRKTKP